MAMNWDEIILRCIVGENTFIPKEPPKMNCQLPWMAKCSVADAVRRFIDSQPYTRTTIALQISAEKNRENVTNDVRTDNAGRHDLAWEFWMSACIDFPHFDDWENTLKARKKYYFLLLSSVFFPQGYLLRLLLLFSPVQMLAVDIAINSCGKRSSVKKKIRKKTIDACAKRKEERKPRRGIRRKEKRRREIKNYLKLRQRRKEKVGEGDQRRKKRREIKWGKKFRNNLFFLFPKRKRQKRLWFFFLCSPLRKVLRERKRRRGRMREDD